MSRSRRKTPIRGMSSADSEKQDKRMANRRPRRRVRSALRVEPEAPLPQLREVSNPWSMDKDGKRFFDPGRHPREMRK